MRRKRTGPFAAEMVSGRAHANRNRRSEVHKQRWVLTLAGAASFMVSLDALVVTTALPTIRHELGASLSSVEWTVNAYTLSFAVLLMSGVALGDRYGRRRMFSFGVALFA